MEKYSIPPPRDIPKWNKIWNIIPNSALKQDEYGIIFHSTLSMASLVLKNGNEYLFYDNKQLHMDSVCAVREGAS